MAEGRTHTARMPDERETRDVTPVSPAEDARTVLINEISWGAVLAGTVVALVVQLVLNLFGIGIGAAVLDPGGAGRAPSASSFSIGAGIWWVLSGLIGAFVGGYAAGRLAGRPNVSTAGWHGLTAWALTTLVIFYLITSAVGGVVGGAFRTLTNAVGNVAQATGGLAQAAAPVLAQRADPFASIEQSLRDASGGQDPAALRDTAIAAMKGLVTGDQAQAQAARERATQALARAQNIPAEEARARVQQYEQQFRQAADEAKRQATAAADAAASAVTRGALFGALALVLGALAGWFGGRSGVVDPMTTMRRFIPRGRMP